MREASTQLVLVVAIIQGLMFANHKHLYHSSRMVVTNVRAQAYGCNSSSVSSSFCSTPRGPNSGVGQSRLTNRPIVHSPLMNALLPPVHARKIPSALSRVQQPERTSFTRLSLISARTSASTHPDVALPWEPLPATRSADANASDGTSVHSSRDFCTGRDGTSTSKLRTPESGSNE